MSGANNATGASGATGATNSPGLLTKSRIPKLPSRSNIAKNISRRLPTRTAVKSATGLNGAPTPRRIQFLNAIAVLILIAMSIYALTNFNKENRDALAYQWGLGLAVAMLYLLLATTYGTGGSVFLTSAILAILLVVTIIPVYAYVQSPEADNQQIQAGQTLSSEAEMGLGIAGLVMGLIILVFLKAHAKPPGLGKTKTDLL